MKPTLNFSETQKKRAFALHEMGVEWQLIEDEVEIPYGAGSNAQACVEVFLSEMRVKYGVDKIQQDKCRKEVREAFKNLEGTAMKSRDRVIDIAGLQEGSQAIREKRQCKNCGATLRQGNQKKICSPCQKLGMSNSISEKEAIKKIEEWKQNQAMAETPPDGRVKPPNKIAKPRPNKDLTAPAASSLTRAKLKRVYNLRESGTSWKRIEEIEKLRRANGMTAYRAYYKYKKLT